MYKTIEHLTKLVFLWLATTCSIVNAETTTQTIYGWLPLESSAESLITIASAFSSTVSVAPIATGPSGIVTYSGYASLHYQSFPFGGPLDEVEGWVYAQGPSYYAEEVTITQIEVIPTVLESLITVPSPAITLKPDHSSIQVISEQAVPTISIIGTSSFTLTETFTYGATCSFSFSTPSATGSATPVPVPIGECIVLGAEVDHTTTSPYTTTRSVFGTPVTTVVFDAAALSQGNANNSNGCRRSQGAVPMGLQFSLCLMVMGVVLGGAMVLI